MKTVSDPQEGLLPYRQQISKDFDAKIQWSDDLNVSIVLEGSLSINYKSHTRNFRIHDIYFFPPFETFSVVSSEKNTRVLTLLIDSGYIHRLSKDVKYLSLRQDHISCDPGNSIYFNLCRDFSSVIFDNMKNELCSKMRSMAAILDMITTIFEAYGVIDSGHRNENDRDRSLSTLMYINDHYSEHISISDVASSLGIHPQYFSAFFNRQFGSGFAAYLNGYRVNQSLNELTGTDHSILDIAMNNGFSNHKTYASAFRKIYSCSPVEYRKKYSGLKSTSFSSASGEKSMEVFSYFRQFIKQDNITSGIQQLQYQQTLELSAAGFSSDRHSTVPAFIGNPGHFMSVGRAVACLRSDVREQISKVRADCGITHIRLRDIFSDALYIYYEDENREPIYSWQSLDSVFDFILSSGIKPFPEIGYMPEKLATKKQYSGWQYKANVSMPRSMAAWKALIKHFLQHYIDKYGIEELNTWYFDFWTSPDLKIKNAYWNDGMENFFEFYKTTYEAFRETAPSLKLGSPNFSVMSGFPWYESFFQYCYANQIYPAYVSIHVYGCELTGEAIPYESFNEVNSESYSISDQNFISENLQQLHQIMNRSGFRSLDVIVSDWNLTFLPKDLIRDTCYLGPYICHTIASSLPYAKHLCYWTLSDIHEDAFPESSLFHGGPGMLDYHGLKKASYNTMALIGRLGYEILQVGDNYIFARSGSKYQLLIYNLAQFDAMYSSIEKSAVGDTHRYNIYSNAGVLALSIMLEVPGGTYYIKKFEVNRNYGSAYDMWGQMGFPEVLYKDMEKYIQEFSVPHVTFAVQNADSVLMLDEKIPPHGVMLLEIQKK